MTTYSYYVEPGYWDSGYTADITVNYVLSSSVIESTSSVSSAAIYLKLIAGAGSASSSVIAAGNYVRLEGALASAASSLASGASIIKPVSGCVVSIGTVVTGASLSRTYPGVNLYAKSSSLAAIAVTRKTSSVVEATSSTKAGSRIFWEMTQPATGTWQTVQPQAEGFGP